MNGQRSIVDILTDRSFLMQFNSSIVQVWITDRIVMRIGNAPFLIFSLSESFLYTGQYKIEDGKTIYCLLRFNIMTFGDDPC